MWQTVVSLGHTIPGMGGIGGREQRDEQSTLSSSREQFVAAAVEKITLVPPWTVHEFTHWLETYLGITIDLKPYPSTRETSPHIAAQCGLLVITNSAAVVWFDSSRSERHQRQQIFHEFAHLLCKHHVQRPLDQALRSGDHPLVAGLSVEFLARAIPASGLDIPTATRVETEAELLGTKLAVQSVPLDGQGPRPRRNDMRVLSLWQH